MGPVLFIERVLLKTFSEDKSFIIRQNGRAGSERVIAIIDSMNKRKTGADKEALAAAYLSARGCRILTRNYYTKGSEIDIIMRDRDKLLCFVEVKYRRTASMGHPMEAVTYRKQMRICRGADYYRLQSGLSMEEACRFDVVAILGDHIEWIQNAFPYCGRG